jgi:hypothetical protein
MTTDAGIVGSQFVGVTASGAEVGVFLIGDETDYSGGTTQTTLSSTYGLQYVCSKTGTVKHGYWYSTSIDSTNSFMVIYNSAESKIAESDELGDTVAGVTEYTFSGVNQIVLTQGQTYRVCLAAAGAINTKAGGTDNLPENTDYPAPVTFETDGNQTWAPWQIYIKGDT